MRTEKTQTYVIFQRLKKNKSAAEEEKQIDGRKAVIKDKIGINEKKVACGFICIRVFSGNLGGVTTSGGKNVY